MKPLHEADYLPPAQPLDVRYADATLLVLNKPAGLLAVPGRGPDKQDCLASRVQAHYSDALVVHRLDMATSGLLLMARGAVMQRALSQAFAAQQVDKRYEAVLAGHLHSAPALVWQMLDLPIVADWAQRPLRKIDRLNGKPSVTRWRVLDTPRWRVLDTPRWRVLDVTRWHGFDTQTTTRVELQPLTGRTHQLRLHMQALGHPIVGDALYAPAAVHALSERLLLHASYLEFAHPLSGQRLAFACPPAF